jgi:signal peptidase I
MMIYFQHRRWRKRLKQMLREAKHVRNLKEDIAEPKALKRLDASCGRAREILKARDFGAMEAARREIENAIQPLCPPRPWSGFAQNVEIVLVAVAVAMAFRTYFIQPFKIPTSSMAPTLHGIHYVPCERPGITDRLPLNLVKWLIFGEWYTEVRAKTAGEVRIEPVGDDRNLIVDNCLQLVHSGMLDRVTSGDAVVPGQLLASGIRITGDHIFVDKVSWNFRAPRRGEIMVFKTTGILHPNIKTNEHYVKRMVGLPGETLVFRPPEILVNGTRADAGGTMARIQDRAEGYAGYQRGGRDMLMAEYLVRCTNNVVLGNEQYFACGDNQLNSLDSRYWGPVPRRNLVGPAVFVYWPLSRHWGPTK